MPNILIRNLPDDVHERLQRRAQQQGQSLQLYLVAELTRLVARPSVDEVLDRVERRSGGSVGLAQAVDDLARDRHGP